MKELLSYFIQVVICSGIFYGYYHFCLRNKKFHQYNRYYLLGAVVGSIFIPFLNIPVYFVWPREGHATILNALTVITSSAHGASFQRESGSSDIPPFTFEYVIKLFYMAVAGAVFIRALLSLLQIRRVISKYVVERIDHVYFVNTREPGTPFSFFRWLFWDQKIELNSDQGQQIFRHELYHIEQRHSWDIVLFEIISIIFWLNPFYILMKREIKTIHEFLADDFASRENDKWNYAELLLMQVLQSNSHRLINPFFHNQVKRRIAMISLSTKPGHQYFRKLMVLPIAALAIGIFAFSSKQHSTQPVSKTSTILNDTANPQQGVTTIQITNLNFKEPAKRSPSQDLLNVWQNGKDYSVWIDNHKVENASLRSYSPNEFSYFSVTQIAKTASGYHSQVNLVTNQNFVSFARQKHFSDIKSAEVQIKGDTLPKKILPSDIVMVIDGKLIKDSINGVIGKMDPNSIESITVLKGDAATMKYGPVAKNGAIEITTKEIKVPSTSDSSNSAKNEISVRGNPENQDVVVHGQDADKVFTRVEVPPVFPDGMSAWRTFLKDHVSSDIARKNNAPDGSYTVWIEFIIDHTGHVTNVKALSNNGYGMEQGCLEAIQQSPTWEPAKQNTHAVSFFQYQPITFVVGNAKHVISAKPVMASEQNLLKEVEVR